MTQKKFRANDHDLVIVHTLDAAANAVDKNVFIADRPYQLISVKEAHTIGGSTNAALDLKKCSGTTAPASGTSMLSAAIDLTGSGNTVLSGALSATTANTKLATGERLAFDFSGTISPYAGAAVTIVLRPTDVK